MGLIELIFVMGLCGLWFLLGYSLGRDKGRTEGCAATAELMLRSHQQAMSEAVAKELRANCTDAELAEWLDAFEGGDNG